MPEQFADLAQTTLSGSINNSVTSLTVADASSFPSSGTFSIIIDTEIMTVTAVSGSTLTVTRNEFGGAAAHSSGATVTAVLTARALRQFQKDMTLSGILSSRPTAGYQGRLYLPDDSPYLYRDNGSSWDAYGPWRRLTPLPFSSFVWFNQGGASVTQNGDAVSLTAPNGTGDSQRLFVQTVPGASFTATALMQPWIFNDNNQFGICLYESGSGKIETHGYNHFSATTWIQTNTWSNFTTYNSTRYQGTLNNFGVIPTWLRIVISGSALSYQVSTDGYIWRTIATTTVTNWFASGPSHVGIFASTGGTNSDCGGTCFHFLAG